MAIVEIGFFDGLTHGVPPYWTASQTLGSSGVVHSTRCFLWAVMFTKLPHFIATVLSSKQSLGGRRGGLRDSSSSCGPSSIFLLCVRVLLDGLHELVDHGLKLVFQPLHRLPVLGDCLSATPNGDGPYTVRDAAGMALGAGGAREAVGMWVDALLSDWGPAVKGTAADL
jgi:hypothetical protein